MSVDEATCVGPSYGLGMCSLGVALVAIKCQAGDRIETIYSCVGHKVVVLARLYTMGYVFDEPPRVVVPAQVPVATDPVVKWRVVPNEMRAGNAFICWDRGPICGTHAPQPWDEDAARTRYIANHAIHFYLGDFPIKLANKLAEAWNDPANWKE